MRRAWNAGHVVRGLCGAADRYRAAAQGRRWARKGALTPWDVSVLLAPRLMAAVLPAARGFGMGIPRQLL